MTPTILTDISYLIERKQQAVEFCNANGKNSSAILAEITLLRQIEAIMTDYIDEIFHLQKQVAELQKQANTARKYSLIVAALQAAKKDALYWKSYDYAAALINILERPKLILATWKETNETARSYIPVAEDLENKLDYYDINARVQYESFCNSVGLNPTKRLAIWQAKTDERGKNRN